MNIAEDIYKISRKYINDSISRSHYPSLSNIHTNLTIEFGEDWHILLPKEKLNNWFETICHFSFLKMRDGLEEIIIHDEENIQYFQKERTSNYSTDLDFKDITLSYKLLCLEYKVDWNISRPFVSFKANKLGRNIRVTLTHASLSEEHSHKCSIRFHSQESYSIESFFNSSQDKEIILEKFNEKKNIIVCGSTGSGKTSLLSSLLTYSGENKHIFIIEDTLELKSPGHTTTRLVASEKPRHSLSDYCSYALRMRPERIILGEIRSHEVVPLILSTNTGHKGILTTLHASSAMDCPKRISTLLCLYSGIGGMNNEIALELVSTGIDIIIFMENKKVKSAIELLGHEAGKINYEEILESKDVFSPHKLQYLR